MAKIYYGKRYNSGRTGNIYIYIKEATCRFPTSLSLFFLFLFHLRIALDGIFFLYDISTQRRPPGSYSLKFFKTQTPIQEPSMSWLCVVIFFKKCGDSFFILMHHIIQSLVEPYSLMLNVWPSVVAVAPEISKNWTRQSCCVNYFSYLHKTELPTKIIFKKMM